jgi:hypothetical protein
MADSWGGLVNGILYMVMFSPNLDDGEVDRVAKHILENPVGRVSLSEQRARLVAAVNAHPLTWDVESPRGPRGEEEVRDFLRRVLERTDELGRSPQPDGPY